MAESRAAKGLTLEQVFLNQTPAGDVVVIYLEGPGSPPPSGG